MSDPSEPQAPGALIPVELADGEVAPVDVLNTEMLLANPEHATFVIAQRAQNCLDYASKTVRLSRGGRGRQSIGSAHHETPSGRSVHLQLFQRLGEKNEQSSDIQLIVDGDYTQPLVTIDRASGTTYSMRSLDPAMLKHDELDLVNNLVERIRRDSEGTKRIRRQNRLLAAGAVTGLMTIAGIGWGIYNHLSDQWAADRRENAELVEKSKAFDRSNVDLDTAAIIAVGKTQLVAGDANFFAQHLFVPDLEIHTEEASTIENVDTDALDHPRLVTLAPGTCKPLNFELKPGYGIAAVHNGAEDTVSLRVTANSFSLCNVANSGNSARIVLQQLPIPSAQSPESTSSAN